MIVAFTYISIAGFVALCVYGLATNKASGFIPSTDLAFALRLQKAGLARNWGEWVEHYASKDVRVDWSSPADSIRVGISAHTGALVRLKASGGSPTR